MAVTNDQELVTTQERIAYLEQQRHAPTLH
jgi:hypothetical protein